MSTSTKQEVQRRRSSSKAGCGSQQAAAGVVVSVSSQPLERPVVGGGAAAGELPLGVGLAGGLVMLVALGKLVHQLILGGSPNAVAAVGAVAAARPAMDLPPAARPAMALPPAEPAAQAAATAAAAVMVAAGAAVAKPAAPAVLPSRARSPVAERWEQALEVLDAVKDAGQGLAGWLVPRTASPAKAGPAAPAATALPPAPAAGGAATAAAPAGAMAAARAVAAAASAAPAAPAVSAKVKVAAARSDSTPLKAATQQPRPLSSVRIVATAGLAAPVAGPAPSAPMHAVPSADSLLALSNKAQQVFDQFGQLMTSLDRQVESTVQMAVQGTPPRGYSLAHQQAAAAALHTAKATLLDAAYSTARGLDASADERARIEELLVRLEAASPNRTPTQVLRGAALGGRWKPASTSQPCNCISSGTSQPCNFVACPLPARAPAPPQAGV